MKHKARKKYFLRFFVLTLFVFVSVKSLPAQDSSKTKILGIKPNYLQFSPLFLKGDSLHLQLKYPKPRLKIPQQYYDLNNVIPKNPLLMDYRGSSYYTPSLVKRKMSLIMNRPTPGEVFPILPIALIAAKLALQQIEIKKKIEIKPQDYFIPRKYWAILKALWKKSPQTAIELYQIPEIRKERTVEILKQDLEFLADHKLVKPRKSPNEPVLYFVAQSRGKAIELLNRALQNDLYSLKQKKRWLDLRDYILNDDESADEN
ncbi:MAG: hypothetical protein GXO77_04445 [Calditrichaeota bacterium]|nr:hypothetical protein [Calditrichota bacterium]